MKSDKMILGIYVEELVCVKIVKNRTIWDDSL